MTAPRTLRKVARTIHTGRSQFRLLVHIISSIILAHHRKHRYFSHHIRILPLSRMLLHHKIAVYVYIKIRWGTDVIDPTLTHRNQLSTLYNPNSHSQKSQSPVSPPQAPRSHNTPPTHQMIAELNHHRLRPFNLMPRRERERERERE